MTATPLLPRNAPFLPEDIEMLNKVVARTTPQQRSWLAGFFAGFEAAQRIRMRSPATPVLMITTDDTEQSVRLALAAGARGYIVKSEAGEHLKAAMPHEARVTTTAGVWGLVRRVVHISEKAQCVMVNTPVPEL